MYGGGARRRVAVDAREDDDRAGVLRLERNEMRRKPPSVRPVQVVRARGGYRRRLSSGRFAFGNPR